ncbi:MAG: hypothetical protein EAZ51_08530 [Sphingobacteriales bacterium]|nr:MAG: hypothetical protein EAZ64_02295 [Sphingobacteriales bacterium]TAF78954.1 MAG: hypothetical protein EAZ51_08530 [Sphingobacteriales bacterium]
MQITKAQDTDSLMNALIASKPPEKVTATFKSPRLVLLTTNETQKKNDLAFWIAHRFGDIGGEFGGSHTLFGLDNAQDIYFGFDYGFTDRFTLGLGRSRNNETYNLSGKFKLLEQLDKGLPFSLTLFTQTAWVTRKPFFDNEFATQAQRMSHYFSAILTTKVNSGLSFLLSPSVLLREKTADLGDKKALPAIGFGGRCKISPRLALIIDYTLIEGLGRPQNLSTKYYNPLGAGLEIETGGHVFSLNFQNAPYIIENNFIANTQKSWTNGGVRWGFAVSRNFSLFQKKTKK